MQNHDQIGNTPFGTRITGVADEAAVHAAVAIVLLSPQIPLLFMGEEWAATQPFPFFCDFGPPLDEAVREGRKKEFSQYPEFSDPEAQDRLPDATAERTFLSARLGWDERNQGGHGRWLARYREMLAIRHREIVPRLSGINPGGVTHRLGDRAVRTEWRMGDGTTLICLANLATQPVAVTSPVSGRLLYSTHGAAPDATLPPFSTAFLIK
jgi:maltooligosyltrehalose trehalohydrolase